MVFPSLKDAIDELSQETQSLSWEDLPSKLQPDEECARHASSLILIGRLVTKKAPNKPSLLETI